MSEKLNLPEDGRSGSLSKVGNHSLDDPLGVLEAIPDPDKNLSDEEKRALVSSSLATT